MSEAEGGVCAFAFLAFALPAPEPRRFPIKCETSRLHTGATSRAQKFLCEVTCGSANSLLHFCNNGLPTRRNTSALMSAKRKAGPGRLEQWFTRIGDQLQCKKCKRNFSIHSQGHAPRFCKDHQMGQPVPLRNYRVELDNDGTATCKSEVWVVAHTKQSEDRDEGPIEVVADPPHTVQLPRALTNEELDQMPTLAQYLKIDLRNIQPWKVIQEDRPYVPPPGTSGGCTYIPPGLHKAAITGTVSVHITPCLLRLAFPRGTQEERGSKTILSSKPSSSMQQQRR